MNDDKFLDRLREDAAGLRYEPQDPETWTRLSARVRDKITGRSQPLTVTHLLAQWFRPVMTTMATLALVATLGMQWFDHSRDTMSVESAMASNNVEISVDGDIYTVAD